MKTKVITILLLLIILIALILHNKNDLINSQFQSELTSLKKFYINTTDSIQDAFENYINQKDALEKYKKENEELKLQLSNQLNYIDESKKLYKIFPFLKKIKLNNNIDLVQTISYIKFNNFSQIILTKPEKIEENRIYGLLQKGVVGGIARVENGQLIGYLVNDNKSRFSVFVGKMNAPGIAIGSGDRYTLVQFIPKWFNINVGDKVVTSGLDGIFYSNIPVGIVKKIELQGNFKVAHIDTYSDILHPNIFFLIKNIKPAMLGSGVVNYAQIPINIPSKISTTQDRNKSSTVNQKPASLSSTPLIEIDQTKEYEIDTTKPIPQNEQTQETNEDNHKNNSPKPSQPEDKTQDTQENTGTDTKPNNLDILNQ